MERGKRGGGVNYKGKEERDGLSIRGFGRRVEDLLRAWDLIHGETALGVLAPLDTHLVEILEISGQG